jgi:hypothetical protein
VQPVANQQAPQQIPGRPQSGGTAATTVPVNTSRVTMNAGNASPGTIDQSNLQVLKLSPINAKLAWSSVLCEAEAIVCL